MRLSIGPQGPSALLAEHCNAECVGCDRQRSRERLQERVRESVQFFVGQRTEPRLQRGRGQGE